MRILLIDHEDICRHAIGTSLADMLQEGGVTAYPTFARFRNLEISARKYEVAIVDPGAAELTDPTIENRTAAISDLIERLSPDCRVIVLTGGYHSEEAERMASLGVSAYLSKTGVNTVKLRGAIQGLIVNRITASEVKPPQERFPAALGHTEMLGYLVDQGIFSASDLAEFRNVDEDTIRRYMRRARKTLK